MREARRVSRYPSSGSTVTVELVFHFSTIIPVVRLIRRHIVAAIPRDGGDGAGCRRLFETEIVAALHLHYELRLDIRARVKRVLPAVHRRVHSVLRLVFLPFDFGRAAMRRG